MNPAAEWLEADGRGGFASGTASGIRSRRYHALLLAASAPPAGRFVLVNGFDAWVETRAGRISISSQRYTPDVTAPDGSGRLEGFAPEPWPSWNYRLGDGLTLRQELFVPQGIPAVVMTWRAREGRLVVQPFLSGRDYHSLHHYNPAFRFEPEKKDGRLTWQTYPGVPPIQVATNGRYEHFPTWFWNFQYDEERARGVDFVEDLPTPGTFTWDLSQGEAFLVFSTEPLREEVGQLREAEARRRKAFASSLHRAADAYLVKSRRGRTIVAGYPWFTDWGRDTFVAMRGLCFSTGRFEEAREILLCWAATVTEGMLPNRFPDQGEAPECNSVDASLWYVLAVQEFLRLSPCSREERAALMRAVEAILEGYSKGTRFGIRADADGLIRAGEPGLQLTWMDAKVGDIVVTPRIGKPVEIQALWLKALSGLGARWSGPQAKGLEAFRSRFWNEASSGLYDVIDADHVSGRVDGSFRPNQIFAAELLDPARARRMLDAVESRLVTPAGLRSLAPEEPGYRGRYEGGPAGRDGAYHQGTVWPWLMGAFVEAWIGVRGNSASARSEARDRFVKPLLAQTELLGLGHLFEIADGDAPHAPRGCPFQAWSVGELLRLDALTRPTP
jgi:predicted glycogen debranching enzyme